MVDKLLHGLLWAVTPVLSPIVTIYKHYRLYFCRELYCRRLRYPQMLAHYLTSNYLDKAYMVGPNPPMLAKLQTVCHFRLRVKRNGYVKEL